MTDTKLLSQTLDRIAKALTGETYDPSKKVLMSDSLNKIANVLSKSESTDKELMSKSLDTIADYFEEKGIGGAEFYKRKFRIINNGQNTVYFYYACEPGKSDGKYALSRIIIPIDGSSTMPSDVEVESYSVKKASNGKATQQVLIFEASSWNRAPVFSFSENDAEMIGSFMASDGHYWILIRTKYVATDPIVFTIT